MRLIVSYSWQSLERIPNFLLTISVKICNSVYTVQPYLNHRSRAPTIAGSGHLTYRAEVPTPGPPSTPTHHANQLYQMLHHSPKLAPIWLCPRHVTLPGAHLQLRPPFQCLPAPSCSLPVYTSPQTFTATAPQTSPTTRSTNPSFIHPSSSSCIMPIAVCPPLPNSPVQPGLPDRQSAQPVPSETQTMRPAP